jgi:hypothetical protein
MADYFPIRLHKTVDIPPTKSYIFGYHPHGIISLGAFVNFATDGVCAALSFASLRCSASLSHPPDTDPALM